MKKKSNVSKKTSIYHVIEEENPTLTIVLVMAGIILVGVGVSWVCGEIATRTGCITPRNFEDKCLDGFLILGGIGVIFFLIVELVDIIKKVCTCIKSCQLPLTEDEIEKLQLLYVTDYWEYVHAQLSYSVFGKKYYLHGVMERIEEQFVEQLVKMLEKELKEADTEYLKRLKNLESEYIFKNIAKSVHYIAYMLEEIGKDVIYQGFGICKSSDFRYVYTIASEKQLWVIPISIYDYSSMSIKKMSIKEIKKIREQGCELKNGKIKEYGF